ncbi:MAG: WD40 repeat domain-containing protein [Flavobacteriales bacterium]|nr:WD40 repeat domain-containing protein [Flavobacteriales bacterium]
MKKSVALIFLLFSVVVSAQTTDSPILFKLQGHVQDLECLELSGNEEIIISGGWGGMVNVFFTDSNYQPITTIVDHVTAVKCISMTPDSKRFITGGNDGSIYLYDRDSSEHFKQIGSYNLHRLSVNDIFLDRSGKFFYTGSNDGNISLYNIAKKKNLTIKNENPISAIAVMANRRNIYCSDNTGIIKNYDVAGRLISSLEGHTDQVNDIVLSRNNQKLYSASSDKTIKIWNVLNGKLDGTLVGHDWKVISLAISNNGKFLVSGSNDGSIKVWDLDAKKEITSYDNLGSNVKGLAISNDNTKIFVAMEYQPDSFETKGILVLKSGIEIKDKDVPKLPPKYKYPKGYEPKNARPNRNAPETPSKEKQEADKKILKKTSDIEISEQKPKKE